MLIRNFHRRNLPHLYYNEGIYFVTFRLYGSIHPNELKQMHKKIHENGLLHPHEQKKLFKKYDLLLDNQKNDIKYLIQPEILEICKTSIQFFDDKEYKLICYCIMPNHIHIVFELINKEKLVGDLMGSIKKYTARESNLILKRKGKFWQHESFDRLVRDDVELYFTIRYVLLNPVNAGLVTDWKKWQGTYCRPEFRVID